MQQDSYGAWLKAHLTYCMVKRGRACGWRFKREVVAAKRQEATARALLLTRYVDKGKEEE